MLSSSARPTARSRLPYFWQLDKVKGFGALGSGIKWGHQWTHLGPVPMTLCVSSETLLGVVALPAHLGSPASLLGPSPPGRASLRGPGLLTAALHPSETQTTPSFE